MYEEALGAWRQSFQPMATSPGCRPTCGRVRSASVEGTEAGLDVIEIVGAIKWFDVAKGFGFIVPDDGRPDVLLHVTCLRRDGYQTAYEGARVVVEALNRPGGLQAFRILSMDEFDRAPSRADAGAAHPCHASSRPASSSGSR